MVAACTDLSQKLHRCIGLADACELLAATFCFPTPELANALVDGSYASDCTGCFADMGASRETLDSLASELEPFKEREVQELLDALKKGNSILYLAPGLDVPVWPYESPFHTMRLDPTAKPSLFRTQIALDIEALMRDAGVAYEYARTDPIDSIWNEFSYLSFLYGSLAQAIQENNTDQATEWQKHIDIFTQKHVANWFSDFMAASIEQATKHSYGIEYKTFARIGALLTQELLKNS
ncbi:MAG: molecular chaperone TorD family protein [Coriobacteriales bacterium]|nr:molecular chaperone TorD family protein [Coriobacteriales bacterium]